jgi:hypothetical protein
VQATSPEVRPRLVCKGIRQVVSIANEGDALNVAAALDAPALARQTVSSPPRSAARQLPARALIQMPRRHRGLDLAGIRPLRGQITTQLPQVGGVVAPRG